MLVDFHKMHGAGNDFVLLDARNRPGAARVAAVPELVARLADRHRGVGFDQLVLIEADGEPDAVRVRFFNPDGGESGACGNGSRCAAWFVSGGEAGRRLVLRTAGGMLAAEVLRNGTVSVDMGVPALDWRAVPLAHACDTLALPLPGSPAACSMGNPHATLFDSGLDPERDGPALECDPLFPERANIGFAERVGADRLRLVVWERGAGLTLACGSGACAAAVNAHRLGLCGRRVAVEMPGGELDLEWREDDDHVLMAGPVATAFTGRVSLGLLPGGGNGR
ncbi:MAG: diaminopimelate epimerase [Gluconacetobacter diazotrophicus]|nr:diaminopimelate epimerase [Gluconacetobacter diazotrophicus]